ncbi:MAG: ATP-binding protein [Eubacterium sp.]|nr:ATP-binding protein [Eubacterium sp.]
MGMYINSSIPYAVYKEILLDPYFVDKSSLIDELIPVLGKRDRYICITRPRRFGKTVMAAMIAAFFGTAGPEGDGSLFDHLEIASSKNYAAHLHKHPVIYIDFSRTPETCSSYLSYISRIINGIKEDLLDAFPTLSIDPAKPLWDMMQYIFEKTKSRFIFVLDEWDAVFHMPFLSKKDQAEYLLFLKNLLKDQIYAELAYMTGILPIAQYSSGSQLNMFVEYDMAGSEKFCEYFGFLNTEVDRLYHAYLHTASQKKITRQDLRNWYDGYHTATGKRLYNPRSVVLALTDNQLRSYWTSAGPYDEIFYYIRNNIDSVRDDLALLAAGEHISAKIGQFTAVSMELETREQIYSAMVVYGLLTYEDGEVFIPNKELMDKYNELLLSKDSLGYVYRLAKKSEIMLRATINGDTKTMEEILQFAHHTEAPILSYNNETELSAVVNLCYLAARDSYRIEREDKAGKGYVDFIFYPQGKHLDGIILELKVDSTPQEAIRQIKEKQYAFRFQGTLAEKNKLTCRILAVGISYSKKTKEHHCKIEILHEPSQ